VTLFVQVSWDVIEYIGGRWRPEVVSECSYNLRSAVDCPRRLSREDA